MQYQGRNVCGVRLPDAVAYTGVMVPDGSRWFQVLTSMVACRVATTGCNNKHKQPERARHWGFRVAN